MANSKISALTAATTPVAGTETLPIVQGGATKQVSIANLTAGRAVSASSLSLTTPLTVGNGGTGTSTAFTSGSVVFAGASGVYSQDNTTFFWDNTNKRLGINTATPSYPLDVSFGGGNIARFINTSGRGYVRFDGKSDFTHQYYVNGSSVGVIQTDSGGNEFYVGTTGSFPMYFTNNNAITMTLAATGGNVTVNTGNLVIGTSGKGIDFSATPGTGTSELLADYEEGTWTPVITPAAGAITSYTVTTATYTKVGRLVMATTRFTITNSGTGTGGLDITLPFTAGTQNSTGTAFESALTGDAGRAWVASGASSMLVAKYNNVTYCVTNSVITATAIYSV